MKKKDLKELRSKTQEELVTILKETKVALVRLRMELATAKIKNVRIVSRKKDGIAKILTIIGEKKELKGGK